MYRFSFSLQNERAAQHPETSVEKLRELAWDEPPLMLLVAQNPATPASLLEELLARDVLFWFRAFGQEAFFPSFLEELRRHIARHPNASAALLDAPLSLLERVESPSSRVRCLVAGYKETPADILQRLSQDPDGSVRMAVAEHPNTSLETLQLMAKDPNEYVRILVTQHPNTPLHTLQALGLDDNELVRSKIAERGGLPYQMLLFLAAQDPRYLRQLALHPETPEDRLEQLAKDDTLLPLVLQNHNAPIELLYACAEVPQLQELVAKNPRTPVEVLQILPNSTPINRALLENSKLPPDWVEGLLTDKSPEIRAQASQHPNAPVALLQLLRRAGASPDCSQWSPLPRS
jgi:hypothetical protein